MTKIYVAHSIEKMDWVKSQVFPELTKVGFIVIDPFGSQRKYLSNRSEEDIRKDKKIKELMPAKWCVDNDKALMKASDGMLVLRDGGDACGSIFEMVYMALILDNPVVFVDLRGAPLYHPWISHHCICVTNSIETAIESLRMRFMK